jgi:hypothetical protein
MYICIVLTKIILYVIPYCSINSVNYSCIAYLIRTQHQSSYYFDIFSFHLKSFSTKNRFKIKMIKSHIFPARALVVAHQEAFLIRVACVGHATSPVRFARVPDRTLVFRARLLICESPIWQSVFSNVQRATTKVCREMKKRLINRALMNVNRLGDKSTSFREIFSFPNNNLE